MCTVTFIARRRGYALAMSRDEKLTRMPGLPPTKKTVNGCSLLSPSEPAGGTWIALNDKGATFALINWYSIIPRVKGEAISRGVVANAAGVALTPDMADAVLAQLPLQQINPFRLIGVFLADKEIVEWRWNLEKLTRRSRPWKSQQWISSGYDEPAAQRVRSQTFRRALQQKSAGSLPWLRRLHRSHDPECGPFSVCMHRADAATVSYTELTVQARSKVMSHHCGAPCRCQGVSIHRLCRGH